MPHVKRNRARCDKERHTGLHVPCSLYLSDFNENLIFSIDFQNMPKHEISRKSIQWDPSCSTRTDGRTDMTKLIVYFTILRKCLKIKKNQFYFTSLKITFEKSIKLAVTLPSYSFHTNVLLMHYSHYR